MRDYLQIERRQSGAAATLHVSGELDIASVAALKQAVADSVDGQNGALRLDISGLTFMDSTGAQALLHIHNAIEARGSRVVFEAPRERVRGVLELLGLDQVLDIKP